MVASSECRNNQVVTGRLYGAGRSARDRSTVPSYVSRVPETESYDLVVIGAGQGGGPLAGTMAEEGWRTALVERKHVGGTCVNEGCTPTKTMVASARVAHLARRAGDYGVEAGSVSVRLDRVRARKREIVELFRSGSRSSLEEKKELELIEGDARFVGERRLVVDTAGGGRETIVGDRVVINTGAHPFIPPIDGLDGVDYLDSTAVMELAEVPDHLMVMGGGYVGLEFAQMFRRFGARVSVVQRDDQLLSREDADVAAEVVRILREDGIEILLSSEVSGVRQTGDRSIELTVDGPSATDTLEGSHLLVATGRRPSTDGLGLEAAGVETTERGHVRVDERLRTSAEGVRAIGDVKGGPAFTHVSYDDYRILRDRWLGRGERTTEERIVPYTVFIDPQLGRVGLTERQARELDREVRVAALPMSHVARAIETDETRGLMKAVVDAESGQILGAAILGPEGGEVAAVLQMAMMGAVPYTRIRDRPFAHPTYAESLNNLFATLDD